LLVRSGSFPYSITAAENAGTINLAVVNGDPPENPSASINLLKRDVYNLIISLSALESQPIGLLPPRPNPFLSSFHSTVAFLYNLSETDEVNLAIVSEAGQFVIEKDLGRRAPGIYQFVWNGKDKNDNPLASGIYLAILTTSSGGKYTQKIAIVR
ncbi:MAG: FlgD immunoglobulin-like domain containing protein, partial [bacterium]